MSRASEWARRIGLPVVLAAGFVGFALVVRHHEPFSEWLFFRYAAFTLGAAVFTAACLSSGHAFVRRALGGRVLPLLEHVTMAFAAGVYLFFLGTILAGFAGLLGRVFFFAFPVLLFATGAVPALRFARRAARHLHGAWRRSARPPAWSIAVHAFGLFGLLIVYLGALVPSNAAFDARWYHLGIAEHYAAVGAVERFPEGWLLGAAPHLASLLYTWAFLAPTPNLADKIEMAAHVELAIFLFSILSIPALVRRLVSPRLAPNAYRYAWAARFLFPGVFLYDSSVCLGADHIAAVFAAPTYLALLRAWKKLDPRACLLLALALSGALLTKYTGAFTVVVPAVVAIVGRALYLLVHRVRDVAIARRDTLLGPLTALGAGLAFTAPHWLKNILWYRDPAYPFLHKLMTERPWTVDSTLRMDVGFTTQMWPAERSLTGLGRTLRTLATFSFIPNDWEKFHGSTPVFGSLFTLSILALPFLRGTKRIVGLFLSCHLGIFVWYWISHQDRYLQAALPWMAAATAATLGLVYRQGIAARIAASALIALQIVWGADVALIPGHVFLGVPLKAALDLFSHTPGKHAADRLTYSDAFVAIGRSLPPRSKPLLHEVHTHLGIGAPSVSDCGLHQAGISYLRTPTPREVYDELRSFGVTHLVYRNGTQPREADTLGSELVFFNFVQRATRPPASIDGWLVAEMPKEAPADPAPDPVLLVTCGKGPAPGLYHLADLAIPSFDKKAPLPKPMRRAGTSAGEASEKDLVDAAQAVAQDQACTALPAGVSEAFVKAGWRDPYHLWIRRK